MYIAGKIFIIPMYNYYKFIKYNYCTHNNIIQSSGLYYTSMVYINYYKSLLQCIII